MGTSNLYNGPKGNALLPDGYVDPFEESDNTSESAGEEKNDSESQGTEEDDTVSQENTEQATNQIVNTTGSWTTAKKSYNNLFKDKNRSNIRNATRNYVKALGGHKKAAQQSLKAKRVTSHFIDLFGGGAEQVKRRLTELGIQFDGRPTKDIFKDLLHQEYLLPPSLRENALVYNAVLETYSDLFDSDIFTSDSLEMFDKGALAFLICAFLKHYIFDKMIQEVSRKEFSRPIDEIKSVENGVYDYVSSCVDVIVPKFIKDNKLDGDIKKKVDDIYNGCYKMLEEGLSDVKDSSKNQ